MKEDLLSVEEDIRGLDIEPLERIVNESGRKKPVAPASSVAPRSFASDPAARDSGAGSRGEKTVPAKENLLIVEDDNEFRNSLSMGARMKGYGIFTAKNGVEALALFATERIDLVITDMRMPDMNGVELLGEIRIEESRRGNPPKTPVVLITGFADYDAVVKALRLGAADYLSKPFSLDEFFNIISMHLELKKAEQDQRNRHLNLEDVVKQRTQDLLSANYKLRLLTEDKNQFIGVVSHELRNPLTVIYSCVESIIVAQHKLDAEQVAGYLHKVREEVSRMLRLLNDLLALQTTESSNIPLQLRKADIIETAKNVLSKFHITHPGITINLSCPSQPLFIEMDVDKIEATFINIIDNAIKYSPEKTAVDVSVIARERCVEVRVADHGLGIPPENIENIFNAFFRGSNVVQGKQEGFGLGLLICRNIIQAHQGKIWVESELNKGSAFIFQLPTEQTQTIL